MPSKLSIRTTGENVPVILLYVKLKIKTFFYKKELYLFDTIVSNSIMFLGILPQPDV